MEKMVTVNLSVVEELRKKKVRNSIKDHVIKDY